MVPVSKAIKGKIPYLACAIGLGLILMWVIFYNPDFANDLPLNVFLVLGSLTLLLGASEIVLEFSLKLAEYAGVSEIVIGLTIVSIGTSIPEMFTSVASALQNAGGFVLGDIYGSLYHATDHFLGHCHPVSSQDG